MIDEIVGQAEYSQSEYHGNQFKKVVSGSGDPDTNKETNVKLAADIAGVGKMTDTRLKKETLR